MKIHGKTLTIGDHSYHKGDEIPWHKVYPFFLLHMLLFGGSGFAMAYAQEGPGAFFLYLHGGFAIFVYTMLYLTMFGRDEVKWMFINAVLGLAGIYTQIDWMLSLFGKKISDFPIHIHVIPFLYYVLYTFLVRQAILDITRSREDHHKKQRVEFSYVVISALFYAATYFFNMK